MTSQLLFTLLGGLIGIVAGSPTTVLAAVLTNRRRSKSIRAVALAEVTAIKEKAERFINDQSGAGELGASTPLLTSIAAEFGYLSGTQAVAFRRAVTLDAEMRNSATKEKAALAIEACREALECLMK